MSHRLSLIAIHSGVLAYRDDLTPTQVREAASTVRDQAEEASTDLRDIIGALRIPRGNGRTRQNPGEVIREARDAGQRIDTPDAFPSQTDLDGGLTVAGVGAVDAMLRECLNNASRHAPGTTTTVTGGVTGSTLSVSVVNPRTDAGAAVDTSGFGLQGLAERADLAGGRLDVEKTVGHFTVILTLPWQGGRS